MSLKLMSPRILVGFAMFALILAVNEQPARAGEVVSTSGYKVLDPIRRGECPRPARGAKRRGSGRSVYASLIEEQLWIARCARNRGRGRPRLHK